ncbi:MAG: hypothetical protein JWQ74_2530 [Marmoricola sp.]|nr:hypothetical protein [Marmoricola sp.]
MPWSPSYDDAAPDPRLDPFRGRAGVLSLDGTEVGHVLVETDFGATRSGGALWWSRWEPGEFAVVVTRIGTELGEDLWLMPEQLDGPVTRWAAGEHDHAGTTYAVTWLDEAGSDQAHREVFGHHH